MKRHADSSQIHDSEDDVSDTHTLTVAQVELAAILGWGPRRFTRHQWAVILDVEAWAARPLSAPLPLPQDLPRTGTTPGTRSDDLRGISA